MGTLTAEQLSAWTGGTWLQGRPDCVDGFSIDTRTIRGGELFVALKTDKRDGHDYLPQACSGGARAALVSREVSVAIPQLLVGDTCAALQVIAAQHRRNFAKPLIAVTGSCGKTSTKDLLATLLGDDTLRTEGNLNNYLGLPLTLLRLRCCRHHAGVVEVGISVAGEMAVLARIAQPDIAIVTNVSAAHLEGLGGTLEDVAREKAMLPGVMAADKTAIFPASCLQFEAFRSLRAHSLVVAREGEVVDLPGSNYERVPFSVTSKAAGMQRLTLGVPGREPLVFDLPRLSAGMLSNATLALTAAQLLGVSAQWMQIRLGHWRPGAFRGEIVRIGNVDFYIANPASMRDSVGVFQDIFPNHRRLYLLGCMNELGAQSGPLHHDLGRSLRLGKSDHACIIGREAGQLREGLLEGGASPEQVCATASLDEARACLERFSADGGAVLLKGSRGYRLELLLPDEALSAKGGLH